MNRNRGGIARSLLRGQRANPSRWHVITGAPCSGKTTAIKHLQGLGYDVVHEVARAYMDEQLQQGKTIQQVRGDELAFERRILEKNIQIESCLSEGAFIFLDRAVPDSIAYFKLAGFDPVEPLQYSRMFRYGKIFLFERLDFQPDAVRIDPEEKLEALENFLLESYQGLGYDVIRVPPLQVEDRVALVLDRIKM
ncbi:MAG: ATP-binding protein [Desulfobacterales bacterium]|nr:ATP-binding protein [Desulfobacterales bacterium]